MHEHDLIRTGYYPSNFVSTLSGHQELKQLTRTEVDHHGRFFQHAGDEMLDYYGLTQGRNLCVGPTLEEAGL